MALLFIDLDGFKVLNDDYRHEAGDACLKVVASRLSKRLRGEDMAGRFGGDEFLVVLDHVTGAKGAALVAAQLIALINQPIAFGDQQLQVGASIGISLYPDNSGDALQLPSLADQAMYQAKGSGKNQTVFSAVTAQEAVGPAQLLLPTAAPVASAKEAPEAGRRGLLEAIVDRTIIVYCLLIVPVLLVNFWRIAANNAAPNFPAVVVPLLVLAVLALGRHLLPMQVKSALICSIGLLIAIPGTLVSGLAAPGAGWAFAVSIYLVSVIFSNWVSRIVAVLIPLTIAFAAIGFTTGRLGFAFDIDLQSTHPGTWLVFILAGCGVFGIILSVWSLYKKVTDDLIQQTSELQRLADFDPLTGLPLQRLLEKRFLQSCNRARRAKRQKALLFVDLDGFKAVNDQYGHDAGDYCLRQLAARMSKAVNEIDTVARIGGDEFLVLVDSVSNREQLQIIAKAIVDTIILPLKFEGNTFCVTASLGAVLFPEHGNEFEPLRKSADAAMY